MIAQVTGRVIGRDGEATLIEVGGVGLEIVATRQVEGIASLGAVVTVQTHLHVREDALQLFGFSSLAEKRLFRQLMGVTGVGPKLALAICSAYPAEQIERAILSQDIALLSSVSGVGKKTAQRICIDLRDKVAPGVGAAAGAATGTAAGGVPQGPDLGDPFYAAREALVALGFGVPEAEAALVDTEGSTEERVRAAFGRLSGGR